MSSLCKKWLERQKTERMQMFWKGCMVGFWIGYIGIGIIYLIVLLQQSKIPQ